MGRKSVCASLTLGILIGLLIGFAVSIIAVHFAVPDHSRKTDAERAPPSYGKYEKAAVAADAGPCSVIGKDMLKKGGSVVDAGIAAMLCVGLYHAQSAGIGGGGFMTIYDAKSGESVFINSREVAPLAAHDDLYHGNYTLSTQGGSAIAVPGEIAGYWEAHKRFGKLEWRELFEPSIKLAAEGYRVDTALADALQVIGDEIRSNVGNLSPIFTRSDGELKGEGDMVFQPNLARTLQTIANEGGYSFYNGSLAKEIIADIKDATGMPSLITEEDLKHYRAEVKQPLNITLNEMTVLIPGGPSGGPILSLILNILKGYNFSSESIKDVESRVLTYHRIVEAFKYAFARRSTLGDSQFVDELVANMTSESYAEELRLKINDSYTQPVDYYGPIYNVAPEDAGTAHVSIVGEDGSAISMTSTIAGRFGSEVRGLRTGIIFNDEMRDFSMPNISQYGTRASPNNFIQPAKRPLSSMVPVIILGNNIMGKPVVKMVVGASGGTRIITATSLVIMNNIWFGAGLDRAVSMKRVHSTLFSSKLGYECAFEKDVVEGMELKNHLSSYYNGSAVQAILRSSDGMLDAKGDERKGSYPDGY